jgi:hypothetical protein
MSLYVVGRAAERVSMRGLLTTLHLIAFTVPLAYCKNQALIDAQGKNHRAKQLVPRLSLPCHCCPR